MIANSWLETASLPARCVAYSVPLKARPIVSWCAMCGSGVRASVARLRGPVASLVLECCSGRSKINSPVKESAGYAANVVIKFVIVEETAEVWMWSRPACAGL
jgi:hypothetical protein